MVLPTSSDSHQRLSHFPNGCRVLTPATNIDVASLRYLRFTAAVAIEDLRVELPIPVSGDFDLREPTRSGHQITGVRAIAIPVAVGATCSPRRSNEGIEFLAHHHFDDCSHSTLGQGMQLLLKGLLLGHRRGR